MNIYSSYDMGRLSLFMEGELDHHEVKKSMKVIDGLLDEYMPRDCVIDLSRLSFMDSSGIAVILKINRRLNETGGRAWVENIVGQPRRVIDASGIDRMVKIYLTEEAK